ncbi:FtsX-like permease family protein [Enterococcus cecorum]|uniref:ABC transporter permease n=1 Tax=Enterococcus cecorum TaxID=44008 RepID=UPI002ACA30C9|nr:ABC transporter permease [Enterococcus cecorum]MDZ5440547.1 FtsX-like permease family protein [Enterococcus cecorum]MDZ5498633.1 FtsX-like permease family protein [Enterococcus cecorum]MDZ5500114.1 FtsX-like permease family protein [Enterococcus cecorum]MDZ5562367.1 FtsX-like permease family protein [Enterococcus cecorum]
MNFYVNFRSAFKAINNNRKRSILTMIGIIIGVSAVIAILAIGRSYERQTIESLTKSDNGKIQAQILFNPNDNSFYETNRPAFQSSDLELVRQVSGVESAEFEKQESNSISFSALVQNKNQSIEAKLVQQTKSDILVGRNLSKADNLNRSRVAIINEEFAKDLYGTPENALNRGVLISGQNYAIVGVYGGTEMSDEEAQMASMFGEMSSYQVQIPKKAYEYYLIKGDDASYSILVTMKKGTRPDEVTNKVLDKLKKSGSMRQQGSYRSFDTAILSKGIGKVLSTITYFITAVAGISLFIAGVGVMNMMYISVSERTKEIGIRRALGATQRSIMIQFLIEGVLLTFTGGVIGYFIGMILAYGIGSLMKIHVTVDLFTIVVAVGVSTLIGLIFSVMPAREAAKKDLIDILR